MTRYRAALARSNGMIRRNLLPSFTVVCETKWSETKRNEMKIRSLRNDNLLSCCVYSDILNRKFPPKKPFRPENSDCVECATFSLPRIKFNLSSGVFERRTATGSKTSSLFLYLDATTFVLISVITLIETICLNFQGETAFLGGIFCLEYRVDAERK